MLRYLLVLLFFLCSMTSISYAANREDIRFVVTSALVNQQNTCSEKRKDEYVNFLTILKEYGYEPYFIEGMHQKSPCFLEKLSRNIFYYGVDNLKLKNKGVNEAKSILQGLRHFNFDENTMIIKLTGEYLLNNRIFLFLSLIKSIPTADAVVRCDRSDATCIHMITGCCAIKNKYLIDFLENLDLKEMERKNISLEVCFASYIGKLINKGLNVVFVDD